MRLIAVVLIGLVLLSIAVGCTEQKVEIETPEVQEPAPQPYEGKKILYIDSYHQGYAWSDGITKGVQTTLEETGVELKIHRMDTKRNTEVAFKENAALEAKQLIETFNPDVVIVSDDNGFKYLVQEYYKDAELPFVYCGLNWDSSLYDAPYSNTVGMVEVALTPQLLERVSEYADGDRIGYISGDTVTERKTMEYYKSLFDLEFDKEYWAEDLEEFKSAYLALQDEVDYILFENTAGIIGWEISENQEMEQFILENTKIPSGTTYDFVAPYALIGLAKIPEEQGEWSAQTALEILDGTKPSVLTETTNKKGKLIINMKLAEKTGIVFKPNLLKNAERIE